MAEIDERKLFTRDWKTFWWFIDKLLFFYGIHKRHFYRVGWKIRWTKPPRTVILQERISISRSLLMGNPYLLDLEGEAKQRVEYEINKQKELYGAFVSEWFRERWIKLAKTGDSEDYQMIVEGYKRRLI